MYGVTRALAGVDLSFPAGRITIVEGPNGSGKSTLLALLAQMAKPTAGRVRYGSLSNESPVLRR
ncbi:MAG: ATP-binding cassette domain-containing protein, partial [Polyangiaceae bacterium]|nr:ATP-binding cassette domain-containing protein [Polyangiaceae bacterium]